MPNLYLNNLDHNDCTSRNTEESHNYTVKNGLLMINKQKQQQNNTTISNIKTNPINKTLRTASSDHDSGLDNTNASGSQIPKTKMNRIKSVFLPPSLITIENDKSCKSVATTSHEVKNQSSIKTNSSKLKRLVSSHNSRLQNPSFYNERAASSGKADRICSASPSSARQIAQNLMEFVGKSSTPLLNKSTKKYNSVASLIQNNMSSSKKTPIQTSQNHNETISRSCNISSQFVRNNQPILNNNNPYGVSYGSVVDREPIKPTKKTTSSIVFHGQNASNAFGVSTGSFNEGKKNKIIIIFFFKY